MNQEPAPELTVFYDITSAKNELRSTRRRLVPLIQAVMLLGALIIVGVGVLMDPVNGLLIGFGIMIAIFWVLIMPRVITKGAKEKAAVTTGPDDAVMVLTPEGVRRPRGDGPPALIPYQDVALRWHTASSSSRISSLLVSLPGEELVLNEKLLHPPILEIFHRYTEFTGRPIS